MAKFVIRDARYQEGYNAAEGDLPRGVPNYLGVASDLPDTVVIRDRNAGRERHRGRDIGLGFFHLIVGHPPPPGFASVARKRQGYPVGELRVPMPPLPRPGIRFRRPPPHPAQDLGWPFLRDHRPILVVPLRFCRVC